MARLFVAAWPPVEVVDDLIRSVRADAPGLRWVPAANWHITLRFVGDADETTLAEMLAAAQLPRVTAEVGPRIERLGSRTVVVPVAGVDELAAAARTATAGVGQDDARPFRGHLTIARMRRPNAGSQLVGAPFEARFDIDEVTLVRSELGPSGAAYTTVARFATVASGDALSD